MRAITYHPESDHFTLKNIAEPELETPFDVIVEVHAIGLNPVDAKINYWFGITEASNRDMVGGLDVSGVIVAKGNKVSGWNIGDRVLYHGNMRRRQGGFASFSVHDSRTLTKHPNLSDIEAAASPCAGWTAYRALNDKLHLAGKNSIVIYGASGGVGSYALQLSRYYQLDTIIAVCSEHNFDYATSLGATHCLDYRDQQLLNKVNAIVENQGIECALDCIGGPAQALTSSMLGFDGQLVELVSTIESTQHHKAFDRGLTLHQLSLGAGHVNGEIGMRSLTQAGIAMNNLLEMNIITSPKTNTITLSDIPEVLKEIRQGHSLGKYVAKP
ncbi:MULTISPECIES: zinc-binding dehydrogenase [Vibrio]|uniref:Zinc-binding dehydrogenase n=2 Tax=Vibrio TaxID=662 RepID=A0A7X4RSR1_9VIBR|nr:MULTISPECIES: zinc-binding dehydrogenase [Vibrio]MBF9003202.1 zinc-binding dehydrogenase [Vibrio nitrifigilis]MZI91926.1 zinc-binding dehydrogenase [Vibrio eleionomae]